MPFGGLLTAGIIGAGGSIFSGIMGANASSTASKQYIQALEQAQQSLQGTEAEGLAQYSPYLSAGSTATTSLSNLLGTPGQGLLQPWTGQFTAPTADQAAQTPGYQFQLQQGENAMQNSAAGQGSLLTGRTLAGLNDFAQGTASANYQNVFNNALTQYQQGYQQFLNNQNTQYSRLMGMSSLGLGAAQGASGLISGIGGDIASLYGQQGAARAQGTIGSANALGGILPGIGGDLNSLILLKSLGLGGNSSTSATPDVFNDGTQIIQPNWNPGMSAGYPNLPGVPPTGVPA